MTDDHSTDQFHGSPIRSGASHDGVEPLSDLVRRLGTPPGDVIESWRVSCGDTLPQDFQNWELDQLGVTPLATLVRLDGASDVAELATPLANSFAGSQSESSTLVSKSSPKGSFNRYQAIVLAGLTVAVIGIIYSATRPGDENRVSSQSTARSSSSDIFSPGRSRSDAQDTAANRVTPGDGVSIARPSTEPLETLGLIEDTNAAVLSQSSGATPSATLVDPAKFSLNSLIPPMQSELPSSPDSNTSANQDDEVNPLLKPMPLIANAIAPPESGASDSPATMDEVLATGDDAPPNEIPQPIRSGDEIESSTASTATIVADPLVLSIETSDQQPTWDLKQPIPTSGVRLAINFDLPDGIHEGWIEPVDEMSPRRLRAIAIVTPENEESVAIGIRFDVRCSAKLSIRMRFAARLDPTLPWQMISRDTLLKSIDYVGAQSALASTQLAQIEAFYSKADSNQKRSIREQRDAARIQVEQFKLVLMRLAELRELADKLETDGRLMLKLSLNGQGGDQVLLETVRKEADTSPEAQADSAEQGPTKQGRTNKDTANPAQ
jgi:hypothetical protein